MVPIHVEILINLILQVFMWNIVEISLRFIYGQARARLFNMFNMKAPMLVFLAAMLMSGSPASASESTVGSGPGYSAASLAKLAGLEITDELVVGSIEAARQGILPLANTRQGKTYAIFSEPEDLAYLPPPRFKKPEQNGTADFGAELFLRTTDIPYSDDDGLYMALFRERTDRRRLAANLALKPLIIVETKTDEPARKSPARKPGGRQTARKPQEKNQTGSLQWVVKGQARKDYF